MFREGSRATKQKISGHSLDFYSGELRGLPEGELRGLPERGEWTMYTLKNKDLTGEEPVPRASPKEPVWC